MSISPKVRLVLSKLGSLILLFQRSPIVQMILPEARLAGVTGAGEIAKWSVAVVAGLGVFDSVAGATTITQLAPSPGSASVPATDGKSLSFTVQLTGTPYTRVIDYWTTLGTMPAGLSGAINTSDKTIYTISGIPSQVGSFPIDIKCVGYSTQFYTQLFTINVSPCPPGITTQPSSVIIASGTTATLNVKASGTSPAFQWYLGTSGDLTHPITGAASSSFTTPTLTSNKYYWVRAFNSAGSVNSNTAKVTVQVPPTIATQPASVTILYNQTATLSVVAKGTSLKYQWFIGKSGTTTNPIAGATSPIFTTPPMTTTTNYWVRVKNSVGIVKSNTATVTVLPL